MGKYMAMMMNITPHNQKPQMLSLGIYLSVMKSKRITRREPITVIPTAAIKKDFRNALKSKVLLFLTLLLSFKQ